MSKVPLAWSGHQFLQQFKSPESAGQRSHKYNNETCLSSYTLFAFGVQVTGLSP